MGLQSLSLHSALRYLSYFSILKGTLHFTLLKYIFTLLTTGFICDLAHLNKMYCCMALKYRFLNFTYFVGNKSHYRLEIQKHQQ